MHRLFITIVTLLISSWNLFAQRAVCPPDTVLYTYEKASAIDTMTYTPNQISAAYQYFTCPQEISVTGARFYGWKNDGIGEDTMHVLVEMRRATQDSIPGNVLLASSLQILTEPDSFNGPLSAYAIEATWPAVDVEDPYVIVVRRLTDSLSMNILHNHLDGSASDGNEEWLSGVREGTSWKKSYDFTLGGQQFDADFLIEPFVNYTINASFINDPECLFDELGENVVFCNDGAPIVDDGMYNRYAFYSLNNRQTWNYGDGVIENNPNPSHFYPTNGPYVATLTTKILNWTNGFCQSSATQIIKEKPAQDFTYVTNNLEVQFTNETFGQYSDIRYDFGDGNFSLSPNPKHKYFAPGNYWVCQTMNTSCGEIKKCENVAVATNTALNCGKDSVRYTSARATNVRIRKLKPTNPGRLFGLGQIFDANQAMIVHGFTFYASHEGLFKDDYVVKCSILDKGGNNLPSGDTLGVSKVHINKVLVDTFYNDSTRYTAIFDNPVQVSNDYVLIIEYDGTVPIHIGVSDWEENDGQNDQLAIGKINDTTWVTSASVAVFNCEGAACDVDVIIEPLVEYNLNANFEYDFDCLDLNQQPVTFEDRSSAIVRSKVYNKIAFNTTFVQAYQYDFDDGSAIVNLPSPSHSFNGPGPFDVTLTVRMETWTLDGGCNSTQMHNVPVPPTGGFSYEQVTSQVNFFDSSYNAQEYLWTFSDNTVSTLANPIHYFTSIGKFEVCQYVSNVCGSDTICDSITVNIVGIPETVVEDLRIYPNPASEYITIESDFTEIQTMSVDIIDLSGRIARQVNLSQNYPREELYVGDLARGTYMLRIKADSYEGTRMMVLTR